VNSSHDAIRRVVEAFQRSDWSEIDVRWGDVRVHLSNAAGTTESSEQPDAAAGDDPDPRPPDRSTRAPADPADPAPPPGAHVVVSPSPGILWRSPEPGSPPFADIGQTVDGSSTVCIVEVMKLMNHVKAGVAGEVVAVYADNGVAVQKGQALFAIAGAGPSS
jgi:acetyl-CoA carboxylase biotin carboxyl carrier protein